MNRYKVEPSRERAGWWVVTDTQEMIVVKFKEHEFNDTQDVTPLEERQFSSGAEMAMFYARVMREMADYLATNYREIVL